MSGIWCFRLILWCVIFVVAMIPGIFVATIIGRIAGFRPGPKVTSGEQVFGWIGASILGFVSLSICGIGGCIDWAVTTNMENNPNFFQPGPNNPNRGGGAFNQRQPLPQNPTPKAIPAEWDDAKMAKTFLSDMQEFDVRVGHGQFGKKGKLGYDVWGNTEIKVDKNFYPNGISMHPPSNGHSTVKYRLNRGAKLFVTHAAMSDVENNWQPATEATFAVLGDNQLLWVSSALKKPGLAQKCRISVEGVDVLELQIHCPGSHSHVRGVWIDPHTLR